MRKARVTASEQYDELAVEVTQPRSGGVSARRMDRRHHNLWHSSIKCTEHYSSHVVGLSPFNPGVCS
jgi:hypothetical protein